MSDFLKLEPAPDKQSLDDSGKVLLGTVWQQWFGKAYDFWNRLAPSVAYCGDESVTLYPGKSAVTQIFDTPLTTTRTITFSTDKVWNGALFEITRTAAATGVSGLDVGGLKTLAVGQWCKVRFDGSNYTLVAFGSL